MADTRVRSPYLSEYLSPKGLDETVRGLKQRLGEEDVPPVDAFVFTGVSGMLVGPTLSVRMRKHMVVVRKDETRHSSAKVEGLDGPYDYVIVDDFSESGETLQRVYAQMSEHRPLANCVGVAFYGFAAYEDGDPFIFDDGHQVTKFAWR